ncbi:MAG: hypothetical protein VYE22_02655 [Myxococcota bacterium]|nr:hypothetical protein [Myxococcota bacterium]
MSFGQSGGGGFGQPPSGGGGFGQPPSGGGGFGQPPSGGGGFGQPPSGGGGPPGGGGGLGHIPFTPEDDANLTGMARFARFAAVAAIVAGVFQLLTQLVAALMTDSPAAGFAGQLCFGAIGLGVTGLLAFFLFQVGKAVDLVVTTDGADQMHLVESLRALKGYFMVKGILYILAFFLFCTCFAMAMMFGMAAFSALR